MKVYFLWHTYRYLPYEFDLARQELETLFGQMPHQEREGLSLYLEEGWEQVAQRTTYFREVFAENGHRVVPIQAQLEASIQRGIQSASSVKPTTPYLRRQNTRYSVHGIHEYRGKFHPQIVRAIGNILKIQGDMWVLDPFCGSGTTLLEAAHNGWNAVGIDINPLGILIAQAKLAALYTPASDLLLMVEKLHYKLQNQTNDVRYKNVAKLEWQIHLPNIDYLLAWFTESVLKQIAIILTAIEQLNNKKLQIICQVVLSDILREVSLQDPDDLRIRRRKIVPENIPVISLFLEKLTVKIETVVKAQPFVPNHKTVGQVFHSDTRSAMEFVRASYPDLLFDAVITSPPYINALPYIDTQRLSLAVLGLVDAKAIRTTEKSLIGNREISNKERLTLEENMLHNKDNLPPNCIQLCHTLYNAIDREHDGFRRQNVPGLAYQYCRDMNYMFGQVSSLLKPLANFVLVVGPNKTVLGGKEFVINTPQLLVELAEQHDFILQEMRELNTYHRYDVHQANSIRSETMLILQRL